MRGVVSHLNPKILEHNYWHTDTKISCKSDTKQNLLISGPILITDSDIPI